MNSAFLVEVLDYHTVRKRENGTEKKNETGKKKLCFLYGSGNIEDQMKGSVKKRGKNLKEEEYRYIGGQRQIRKNINTFNGVTRYTTNSLRRMQICSFRAIKEVSF